MTAAQTVGTPPPAPPPAEVSGSGGGSGDDMALALSILNGAEPPPDGEASPQVAPTVVEKAAPPAPPAPPAETELSSEWAKLRAQKQRDQERFKRERAELETERAATAKARAEADALRAELEGRRAKAKKSPLEALQEIGWTLPQLTKYVAENGELPPERLIEEIKGEYKGEIDSVKKELEDLKAAREEERKAASTRAMEQRALEYEASTKAEVQKLGTDATRYPSLAKALAAGGAERVHQRALNYQVAHFEKNREAIEAGEEKPLALSDAMLYAERELAEIFSWLGAGQAGTATQAGKPVAVKPETEPLSTADKSERTVTPPTDDENESDDDRWAKARKILKGE